MCITNTAIRRRPVAPSTVDDIFTPTPIVQFFQGSTEPRFPTSDETFKTLNLSPCSFDFNNSFAADYFSNRSDSGCDTLRPKCRRKPRLPGKTAKMNDRHFVVHNYHDHADESPSFDYCSAQNGPLHKRRGVSVAFPVKLHAVLDQVEADGLAHIVSWQPHGRCFVVHKPKDFVDLIMPKYFRQSKLTSFQRQLNLYGFCRLTKGPDAGGYYHELFLRGKSFLCDQMVRIKVKGTKYKAASSPEHEPDFYQMRPVVVSHAEASLISTPISVSNMDQSQMSSVGSESNAHPHCNSDDIFDDAVEEVFAFDSGMIENGLESLRSRDISKYLAEDSPIEDAELGILLEQLINE